MDSIRAMPSACQHLLFALILFITTASTAQAQRLGFWSESILSDFSAEEIASFRAVIRDTLANSPDTETILWSSPEGNHGGKILPQFSYESNGRTCRRTLFQANEGNAQRKENYRFDVCQADDGSWEIAAPFVELSDEETQQLETFVVGMLNHEIADHPMSWRGADSNAVVVIVVLDPVLDTADPGCRRAAANLTTGSGDAAVNGQFRFCRGPDGNWDYQPE